MEPVHVFSSELPLEENNIFSVNLAENNETEEIKFKKSKNYTIRGVAINQEVNSDFVPLSNVHAQNALSDFIRTYSNEKDNLKLDLRIYNEESFDVIIPFTKRTDILINGFQYYDTKKPQKTRNNRILLLLWPSRKVRFYMEKWSGRIWILCEIIGW